MAIFIGSGAGDTVTTGAGDDTLYGFGGDDDLNGGDDRDTLFGGTGDDTLTGGNGNDVITGGNDNDTLYGDAGDNTLSGGAGDDIIVADSGNNGVLGGSGRDAIFLGDGNNVVHSGSGDDEVVVGDGDNVVTLGQGNDGIFAGVGDNTIDGGDGNDSFIVQGGNNLIDAGNDDDIVMAFGGANTIYGGNGDDSIGTSGGGNVIDGESGNDYIVALGPGNNTVTGGQGDDVMYTGGGTDTLTGGTGNDFAFAGDGNDTLTGGDGIDTLHGGVGDDVVRGGPGRDRLFGGTGNDTISGGADGSVIFAGDGNDTVGGDTGDDTIFGNYGDDTLKGGAGDDTLNGGSGIDVLNTGVGNDVAVYLAAENAGSSSDDLYNGGAGWDVLRLVLTADESADAAILADIAAFEAFLGTAAALAGAAYTFSTLNLQARNFEDVTWDVAPYGPNLRVNTDASGNESHPTFGSVDLNFVSASDGGRYVFFHSNAGDLVTGDVDGFVDYFVKDTQTGAITRIDIDTGYNGGMLAISGNGDYVSYMADGDLVVADWAAGTSTTIQLNEALGPLAPVTFGPVLSWHGSVVAFTSTNNTLVPGDTGNGDVFVADMTTGAITMASTDAAGNAANSSSLLFDMTGEGRYVAFLTSAGNLVAGDTNGTLDIFVKDMWTGLIHNASTDASGNSANGASADASVSDEAHYVAFTSRADNLVLGDTNGTTDVFRKDLVTGDIVLVSRDAAGNQASGAFGAKISPDGRYILFASADDDLTADDGNGYVDLFLKEVATDAIVRVGTDAVGSIGNDGAPFGRGYDFSSDGSQIVFWSAASDLVPGDTNNVPDLFMTANPFV